MVDAREEETRDDKEPVKAPRSANKPRVRVEEPKAVDKPEAKEEPKVAKSTSSRKVISEGKEFEVEVELNEDGLEVVKESVYRTVNLPNSERTSKVLVKAKGTRVN